jgi:hypothetical protein
MSCNKRPAAPKTSLTHAGEPIAPGQLRTREVKVGEHVAPAFASVPMFLQRWGNFYGNVRRGEAALVALAAAHQRLGWIHPFVDGNGRVVRLHTHTLLSALGYTGGLWSPLRGFARSTGRYYALLADADSARRGDLDGRGNLSEQALIAWIDYALDVCTDQVAFMSGMLDFAAMKARIEACLVFEATVEKSGVRQESLRGLHYLFLSGEEITRGDFKSMLGMSDRGATDALGALVKRGLPGTNALHRLLTPPTMHLKRSLLLAIVATFLIALPALYPQVASAQNTCIEFAWAKQRWRMRPVVTTEQVRAELLAWAPQGVEPGKPVWVGLNSRTSLSGTPTGRTRAIRACPQSSSGNCPPASPRARSPGRRRKKSPSARWPTTATKKPCCCPCP